MRLAVFSCFCSECSKSTETEVVNDIKVESALENVADTIPSIKNIVAPCPRYESEIALGKILSVLAGKTWPLFA